MDLNRPKNNPNKKGGLKGSFPSGGGGSVKTGLSSREAFSSDSAAEGMVTKGPNQMPHPMPKSKVRGKFEFC